MGDSALLLSELRLLESAVVRQRERLSGRRECHRPRSLGTISCRLVRNDTANEQRAVDSALTYMHDISAKMRKLSVADVAPGTAEEQETRALLENLFNNGED